MITRARKIRKDYGKAVSSVCDRTFVHLKSQELWLPTQNLHKINAAKFPAWTGDIQPCILLHISINVVINIVKIITFLPWSKYSFKCFKILIYIFFTVILFLFIYVLSQGVAISPCRRASNCGDPPVLASWVIGLKMCAITPNFINTVWHEHEMIVILF